MKTVKPILIIEQHYGKECIHLMVRIDKLSQVKYLLKFVNRFLTYKKNKKILAFDFKDIYSFDKTLFFSHRIKDKIATLSYLVIDEGKKMKCAFIYLTITCSKKKFKFISAYKIEDYFEI